MRFNDTDYARPGQLDFVPRARRNQIWKIIAAFTLTIVLIVILGSISTTGRDVSAVFLSIMIVATLCFYVVYRKQQSLDLVMNAEYQNLLFSQAVSLGTSFCMFVRRDGTIVYANSGLRDMFPKSNYANVQALEGLFEQGDVSKQDRERVMGAIYSNLSDRLIFPIKMSNGETQDFILTVEPLVRPGGFSVIRGREYRGQRAGMQLLPDVLRSTSSDKLDHMLATTPVPHYTTDAYGRFEYVNPALEQLLGYHPGTITDAKLSIQHMIYQLEGRPLPEDYSLADYSGEALLQRQNSDVIRHLLYQYVMRDETGRVMGATGSIIPTDRA